MKAAKSYRIGKSNEKVIKHTGSSVLRDLSASIRNAQNKPACSSESTTPTSSQPTSETPVSSPQQSPSMIRQATKQYILSFGIDERKQCTECGMSYLKNVKSDLKAHEKYHQRCLNGRDWSQNWGEKIVQVDSNSYICSVNSKNSLESKATLELLEIVNHDLNAPDDNEFWLKGDYFGKVFVYVQDKKAIGVVSVECIQRGKWFSVDDGKVVSDIDVELLAGISRIYVCKNYRRSGIALRLLEVAQKHLIYGLFVPRNKFGWSQPSFSGGKLAKQFNGAKHKSGKILIPVYT